MNSSKRGAVYGFKLQSLDLVSGLRELWGLTVTTQIAVERDSGSGGGPALGSGGWMC